MKQLLERKFFPFVIKPGRYSGFELGQIVKDPEGRTKYLHAFPEKYEIGQAYLGLQTIYHIINTDDRFLCERVFAMDKDAEEVMRKNNIPLFSLESYRAAKDFDVIGFTLSYELVATNMLQMLDLAGIPLHSKDRDESDPIIMAGGPTVYNPEPFADFIDIFFIGDAEEGLLEMLSIIHEMKGKPRELIIETIVRQVKSVYAPRFYDADNKPIVDFAPEQVEARIIRDLKKEFYPTQPIVPFIDVAHNFLSVEIMRGCPQGCRFCQAGPIYRPVRFRKQEDIIEQVETQLAHTGYQEVTLLSLSTSDYPEIEKLATTISRRLAPKRASIALPSLRPETISSGLLDAITRVRKVGLTLAPEAGTERLRLFLRKDFPDEAIYDTIRLAYEKGWTTIKLYFMLGLPTETKEDLIGICNIIRKIYEMGRRYQGRKTINVTLSPFSAKPHTPFQWDEISNVEPILKKIYFIKNNCRFNNVNFKYNSAEMNILQGVIGRGSRAFGKVIYEAFQKGCRFDGWTEDFNWEVWKSSFEENGIAIEDMLKPIPFSQKLPWSIIKKGVSTEHLKNERQRTSVQLKEYVPRVNTKSEDDNDESSSIQYGRSNKKVASRNLAAPTKNMVRIQWGRTKKLKYLSHLDNLRLIERSLRLSNVPVAYSQGFNPSMKLSFGPPLSLGFTSETEFIDITFDTSVMPYMIEDLQKTLPDGMMLINSKIILAKIKTLGAFLNRAKYTLPYNECFTTEEIQSKIDEIMSRESILFNRKGKDKIKEVDIRGGIFDLSLENNNLVMTLGLGEGIYVRPTEVVKLLENDNQFEYLSFKLHRKELFRVEEDGEIKNPMD